MKVMLISMRSQVMIRHRTQVIDIITSDIMPLIKESVLAGRSEWATQVRERPALFHVRDWKCEALLRT